MPAQKHLLANDEEYILISAYVSDGTGDATRMRARRVWFIFPYQDSKLGQEYTTNVYPSYVNMLAPFETYPFLVDGSINDIVLENGTFNLSYSIGNYTKKYTLDHWLSEIGGGFIE